MCWYRVPEAPNTISSSSLSSSKSNWHSAELALFDQRAKVEAIICGQKFDKLVGVGSIQKYISFDSKFHEEANALIISL